MSGKIDFSYFRNKSKEDKYREILPQIYSLVKDEKYLIANLANIVSVLKYTFDYYLWVGFYFIDPENKSELVLGPYQGKVACTRLPGIKGVCWASVIKKEIIVAGNVDEFPGHIACDSDSKSEIVIPVVKDNEVIAVLDVDSGNLNAFDETDSKYLGELINGIVNKF